MDQFNQHLRVTLTSGLPWDGETGILTGIVSLPTGHILEFREYLSGLKTYTHTGNTFTVDGHLREDDYIVVLYNGLVAGRFVFESGLAGSDVTINVL